LASELPGELIVESISLLGRLSVHVAVDKLHTKNATVSEFQSDQDFEMIVEFVNWIQETLLPVLTQSR
jgi:hypothetical protein